jgi:undecaprenyl-diphosphatase
LPHPIKKLARQPHSWVGFLTLAVAFLALGTASATMTSLDASVSGAVHAHLLQPVIAWSFSITELGSTDLVISVTALAVAVLAAVRHWHGALAVILSVVLTQAVVDLTKIVVARPRPEANQALAEASGASFPSAHSATSMALYAMLAFLVARECRGAWRIAIAACGAAIVVSVGFTRILLGAHYPTDVLAGWMVGGAVVVGSWLLAVRLLPLRRAQPA